MPRLTWLSAVARRHRARELLVTADEQERVVTPEDFGLPRSEPNAVNGGDANHNASILLAVLDGKPHPARHAFVLNAAASLAIAKDVSLREAAELARQTIDGGRARACLERWRSAAQAQVGRSTS